MSLFKLKGDIMYEVKVSDGTFEEYSEFDTLVEAAAYIESITYVRATLKYVPVTNEF